MLQIPRLTFAILDAAFGPRSLTISESGGPVRCIDSTTGHELWRHSPGNHVHFLRLWYCNTDESFYGVQWEFQKGSFRSFVKLNAATGEDMTLCQLDSWEEVCCAKLRCLLTSSGKIISLRDGKVLHRLEFPQTDYPDRSDNLPKS